MTAALRQQPSVRRLLWEARITQNHRRKQRNAWHRWVARLFREEQFTNMSRDGKYLLNTILLRAHGLENDEFYLEPIRDYAESIADEPPEVVGALGELTRRGWAVTVDDVYLPGPLLQKLGAPDRPFISPELRKAVYERDFYRCRYCGLRSNRLSLDHVIPYSKGGPDTADNLVTACMTCNLRKHTHTPEEAGMTLLPVPSTAS